MRFIMALSALLFASQANAATREQFVARAIEGAVYYKVPVPQFDLEGVNSSDPDTRHFKITTFGDVRSMMICRHGWVSNYAVDANNGGEGISNVHVAALTAIGLYADGMTWREATAMRDELMREAKAAEPQMAERVVDDAKISLIISFAGAASFVIDPK
jgi:hypothetical protein